MAGCAEAPLADDGSPLDTSTTAVAPTTGPATATAEQSGDFQVRILFLGSARQNHCGHTNPDPENPTAIVQAITVRVRNPTTSLATPGTDFEFRGIKEDAGAIIEACYHETHATGPEAMAQYKLEFLLPYDGEGSTDFVQTVALFRDGTEVDRHRVETQGCNNDGDCQLPDNVPSLNFQEDGRTLRVTRAESVVEWSQLEIWGCGKAPAGRVTVGQEIECSATQAGLFWPDPWYPIYIVGR